MIWTEVMEREAVKALLGTRPASNSARRACALFRRRRYETLATAPNASTTFPVLDQSKALRLTLR